MTSAPALSDAAARERIRTALDVTLVVEAAAGTGKTTELVHRMVAVLAQGTDVGAIVAVTFTEKAAGELKLRLRAGLEAGRTEAMGERRERLGRALEHLEEARINTIHGFCAELLRERPVEARVDPRFETFTEASAKALFADVFRSWLEETLDAPPEGVRRALRRREADGPTESLRRAADELRMQRHFNAKWRREPFAREAELDAVMLELGEFAALTARASYGRDALAVDTASARALVARAAKAEEVRARDYDGLEAELCRLARDREFGRRKGGGARYGKDLARADVLAALEALRHSLTSFQERADAELAACLQEELGIVVRRYERAKDEAGGLDFEDLLLRARDLLRDSADARAEFQARFERIFVDEFQDTDPLQAEILLLLAAKGGVTSKGAALATTPGKLFLVGDPKQAIYRFRRADLAVYERVKAELVASGAEHLHLTTSFRSVPALQALVNAAFAPLMTGDAASLQASYVPLTPAREDVPSQPAIVALPIPSPYGVKNLAKARVRASLPHAIAAFVEWLVEESGFTVTEAERPRDRVPLAARHVCLLFRKLQTSREDSVRPFAQALEGRGIPHVLVGGRALHAREEIEAMVAALSAIEHPEDALSVYAALHGPLFAIADDALLEWVHLYARPHPFRVPIGAQVERLAPVREALLVLGELHRRRNRRPVAETIAALLDATRAYAAFALWHTGEQALANVLYLADLARAHERDGGLSFRGFLERLRSRAEEGQSGEAPILEEASDGVRMMTVHKAKGLEFPVVILADTTTAVWEHVTRHADAERNLAAMELCGAAPWELVESQALEVAREGAEAVRLAYVAATRARDMLVVPIVGDDPHYPPKSWALPILAAIAPAESKRRDAGPARGCPAFGDDSVLVRPEDDGPNARTVAPGLHRLEGGREVVVWDPRALALGKEPLVGVRRDELLGKASEAVVLADLAAHEAFRAGRAELLVRGARPSLTIATATERAGERTGAPDLDVGLVAIPKAPDRPRGPRFGTLVHATLATTPLDADVARVAQVAELEGRILGAPAAEIEAAAAAVSGALAHPLFARARAAEARGACRRETPLAELMGEFEILEGVIDLAFEENGAWTVIDFKTDAILTDALDRYQRQIGHYVHAVARATGAPATGLLLWL